ncbi:MAG: hypothetical protein KGZ30_04530 [Anaplasmataceae bacterium]|nr:hypothetical protein [Anaplasmataceae bacterium]
MLNPLLLLTLFFIIGFVVRNFFWKNLCALCFSVSLTWVVLVYGYWLKGAGDPVVLGILLGGSAVGGVYYLFSKIGERYQIFKFPLLLSTFWFVYQLFGFSNTLREEITLIAVLWSVFLIIFIFYTNQKWRSFGRKIIDCCKNW